MTMMDTFHTWLPAKKASVLKMIFSFRFSLENQAIIHLNRLKYLIYDQMTLFSKRWVLLSWIQPVLS